MSSSTDTFDFENGYDWFRCLNADGDFISPLQGNFVFDGGQRGCVDDDYFSSRSLTKALKRRSSYDVDVSTFFANGFKEDDAYGFVPAYSNEPLQFLRNDYPCEYDAAASLKTPIATMPLSTDNGSDGDCAATMPPLSDTPTANQAFTMSPMDVYGYQPPVPYKVPPISMGEAPMGAPYDKQCPISPVPNFISFSPSINAERLIEDFKRSIFDGDTKIEDQWPETLPPWGCFYGKINMGMVDFCGGAKAGTPYMINEHEGLLVNYSGKGIEKLKCYYQTNSIDKLLKIRLISTTPPIMNEDDWTIQDIRCTGNSPSRVYLYNKMAMYTFGGTMFTLNSEMQLEDDSAHSTGCRLISLSQARSRTQNKPTKRVSTEKYLALIVDDYEMVF